MKGSAKQKKWASEILEPVQDLIDQFPDEYRERHQKSLNRIENAETVIRCRYNIDDWIERTEEWIETGMFRIAFGRTSDQPVLIRTLVY